MSDQVESIVGRPLADVPGLSFAVDITHEGDIWTLRLVTSDGSGTPSTRALTGKSCGDVTDAAAVVIGMAVRGLTPAPAPESAEPGGQPAPEAAPVNALPPRPRETPAPAPARPPRPRRFAPLLMLGGVVDTGALPAPSPGFGLRAGVRTAGLGLELEGTALAPESRGLAGGASGQFSLLAAALLGCVAPNGRTFSVLGCTGVELGRMSGEGRGVTNPKLGDALWDALRFELGVELATSSNLRLTARAGVAVPFARPEFQLDGLTAYRPAPFGVRALLGIELWP